MLTIMTNIVIFWGRNYVFYSESNSGQVFLGPEITISGCGNYMKLLAPEHRG